MKKVYLTGYKSSPSRYVYTYNALREIKEICLVSDYSVKNSKIESLYKRICGFLDAQIIFIGPMEHRVIKIALCKIMNKKVVCDIYAGLFDSTVVDRQLYKRNSIRGRVQWLRDRIAMRCSDRCLFLTEAEKKHFIKSVNLNHKQVNSVIVPLVTEPKEAAELPYYNKKDASITLCWTGSYIPLQGFDIILKSVKIMKNKNFSFKLIVYGPNNDNSKEYKKKVLDEKLNNYVEFIDIWGDLPSWEKQISSSCDISLGIFGKSSKAKSVLANKVLDGVAFRTPVLTGYSKGAQEYFDGNNNIYYCESTPRSIANTIIKISKMDVNDINKSVRNAYKIFEKNFTVEIFNDRIKSIILSL